MTVFTGIHELWTLAGAAGKSGRSVTEDDLSLIRKGAFAVKGEKIIWVGAEKDLRKEDSLKKAKRIHLNANTVLPAFIDPHTHMVFAGDRRDEFELRNRGYSYQELAEKGGGIMSTVRATRAASATELTKLARVREAECLRQGLGTVEIKTGYGLNLATELKMLKVIRALKSVRTVATFLGAHAVPPESKSTDAYVEELIGWLPKVKKFSNRVDMFIETAYFTQDHARKYFEAARRLGFEIVAHTDQLNGTGSSWFAAQLGALSIDHCIRLKDEEVLKIANSKATCVLLPGSDFYLHLPYPPARRLLEAGARVALGTDFNPGSCPTQDLSFVGVLARLEMKMTLPEVVVALTLNGAHALGLEKQIGSLEIGKCADFVTVDEPLQSLFFQVGHHPVRSLWRQGKCRFQKK